MAVDLRFQLMSIWKGKGVKDAKKDLGGLTGVVDKTSSALKALAGAAIVAGIAKLAADSALLSARVETLGVVTTHMGGAMGMAEADVRGLEQSIVDQGITLQASRQMIAQMIQSNIDLANATDIARIAQDAAVIANTNSSDAAQRLTYVLQTGNVRMARTIGLNVDFAGASKDLAASLGIAVGALSEAEIMQARMNAVKEAAVRIEGVYDAAMETTGKKITSLPRKIEDAQLAFGKLFDGILGKGVDAFGSLLEGIEDAFNALDLLLNMDKKIIEVVKEHSDEVARSAMTYEEYEAELRRVADETGMLIGTMAWYRDTAESAAGATAAMESNVVLLTEAQREGNAASIPFIEGFQQMEEAIAAAGGSAEFAGAKFDVNTLALRASISALNEVKVAAGTAGQAIDTNLVGSIGRFLEELAWLAGGGAEILAAFETVKQGVLDGSFTPEEGRRYGEGLFVIATDLEVDLGNITAKEGADRISKELGDAFTDPQKDLDDFVSDLDDIPRQIDVLINIRTGGTGTDWLGGRKQHGGRLDRGVTLVGEAGPELIIDNVVVPAPLTRQLMGLGLQPGRGLFGGGSLIDGLVGVGGAISSSGATAVGATSATPAYVPYSSGGGGWTAPMVGMGPGGGAAATPAAAAAAVVTEIAPLLEQVVPEAVEAAASATAKQIGTMQASIVAQAKQAREQNNLLKEIVLLLQEQATDDGVAESILSGLQTTDLG